MSNYPIKVSTKELIFVKNRPATQFVEVLKEAANDDVMLKITAVNLPRCFTVFLMNTPVIEELKAPCSLKVVYNPSIQIEENFLPWTFKISTATGEAITVNLKMGEEKKTSEVLLCQICDRQYCEEDDNLIPRILTGCGHTLCDSCLKQIQRSNRDGMEKGYMYCPFDRKLNDLRRPPPKNFAIIEMLREKVETEPPKTVPEHCENPDFPCFENPNHEASKYCKSCKAEFCQSCFDAIHSSKIMSTHQSIPVTEKPLERPNCSIHIEKLVEFECIDKKCKIPDRFCCTDCFQNEHKNHKRGNIEKRFKINQNRLTYAIGKFKSSENRSHIRLEMIEKFEKTFDKTNPAYMMKIKSINDYFQQKKHEALTKLDSYLESEKERLIIEGEEIKHTMGLMSETRREMEKRLKTKKNLLNIKEICENAKVLCSLEDGSGVHIAPFDPNMFSDAMTITNSPLSTPKNAPPNLAAGPSRKRPNGGSDTNDGQAKVMKIGG